MKKIIWSRIGHIIVLIMAVAMLALMCKSSNQATPAMPLNLAFTGEYSVNGGEWQPLTEDTEIATQKGETVLRGNFNMELPEGIVLQFYLNHLGMGIYVDGEMVFGTPHMYIDMAPSMCGVIWSGWETVDLTSQNVIEIHLYNPHAFGNKNAVNEFLHSIYTGSEYVLSKYLEPEYLPYRVVGACVLILALMLLGIALAFSLLHTEKRGMLWPLALMSLFAGGYIMLDTPDVSMWSDLVVFNTYCRQLCMMLAVFEMCICIRNCLDSKAERVAKIVIYVSGVADGIIFAVALTGRILLYDTMGIWCALQVVFGMVLLGCCIYEIHCDRKKAGMLAPWVLLLLAMFVEIAAGAVGWKYRGIVVKTVFVLLFVFHLVKAVKQMTVDYQASVRAEKLADDLRSSRVVLAMSQIRTHFIFNVLNAISGMCKYDPVKADDTIVRFARYLRNNINILQEDKPELFSRTMEQLEDYIVLEQVRFGDKIKFEKSVETDGFEMAPLVLQPIVENAIKHGLTPKRTGGTIKLHVCKERDFYIITVSDDGVGFKPEEVADTEGVGLMNVRFRLEQMVNGTMEIESAPGEGTTVKIIIPVRR